VFAMSFYTLDVRALMYASNNRDYYKPSQTDVTRRGMPKKIYRTIYYALCASNLLLVPYVCTGTNCCCCFHVCLLTLF